MSGFILKIVYSFVLKSSVDPDEMPHDETFHLSLRCLQKYSFRDWVIETLAFLSPTPRLLRQNYKSKNNQFYL